MNLVKKNSRGFTLVELLVVIAIVAALAFISFFAVMKAKSHANSAKSVSNLRQLGAGLLSFASENGNRMPNVGSWTKPENPPSNVKYPVSWDGYIFHELGIGDSPVGKAPLEMENLFVHGNDRRTNQSQYARRTYAMFRGTGSRQGNCWDGGQFTPMARVGDPARTALLTERPWGAGTAGTPSFADISDPSQMRPEPETGKDLNAGGKFNIVFVDGHVEALLPERTIGEGSIMNPQGIWTFTADD